MSKVNSNMQRYPYLVRARRVHPVDGMAFTNWPAVDFASAQVFAEAARQVGAFAEVRIIDTTGGEP